ncbi:MAG: M23 family metallopeptidase [Clostridia bacterium]|nr:M23 family metallopeptidase [Clostridia bacterium]
MQQAKNFSDFWRFVKKNLAIILIVACAISATILAVVIKNSQKLPTDGFINVEENTDITGGTGIVDNLFPNPTQNQQAKPKAYVLPLSEFSVGMGYSRDSEYVLVFKPTLNEYSVHNGIDFLAQEGTQVLAINDGVVKSVTNDFGMGWTVQVEHEDGYVSCYSSLSEDITVSVGQTVECGETIGYVANTATYESLEGAHLHFELKKEGEYVNPSVLLEL